MFAIDDGHSDADYAAGPSVSGWAWRAAGAAFLYGSKRQSETASVLGDWRALTGGRGDIARRRDLLP